MESFTEKIEREKLQLLRSRMLTEDQLIKGKTYFRLFHGRNTTDENLQDWGFDGPYWEVEFVHIPYMSEVQIMPIGSEDVICLKRIEDLIQFDSKYYGDCSIFIHN